MIVVINKKLKKRKNQQDQNQKKNFINKKTKIT